MQSGRSSNAYSILFLESTFINNPEKKKILSKDDKGL